MEMQQGDEWSGEQGKQQAIKQYGIPVAKPVTKGWPNILMIARNHRSYVYLDKLSKSGVPCAGRRLLASWPMHANTLS